jgi:hypothetical protein
MATGIARHADTDRESYDHRRLRSVASRNFGHATYHRLFSVLEGDRRAEELLQTFLFCAGSQRREL